MVSPSLYEDEIYRRLGRLLVAGCKDDEGCGVIISVELLLLPTIQIWKSGGPQRDEFIHLIMCQHCTYKAPSRSHGAAFPPKLELPAAES